MEFRGLQRAKTRSDVVFFMSDVIFSTSDIVFLLSYSVFAVRLTGTASLYFCGLPSAMVNLQSYFKTNTFQVFFCSCLEFNYLFCILADGKGVALHSCQ